MKKIRISLQAVTLLIMLSLCNIVYAQYNIVNDFKRYHEAERRADLEAIVDEMNATCPIEAGTMTTTKISLDGNMMVYTMMVDEEHVNLEAIANNKEQSKKAILSLFRNSNDDDVNQLVSLLVKYRVGIAYDYIGKQSGLKTRIVVTYQEINEAHHITTDERNPILILEEMSSAANRQCPMSLADGLWLMKTAIEYGYYVYYVEFDEEISSIDNFRTNNVMIKNAMIDNLKSAADAPTLYLIKLLKENGIGLIYRYIGKQSRNSFDIVIECNEL